MGILERQRLCDGDIRDKDYVMGILERHRLCDGRDRDSTDKLQLYS